MALDDTISTHVARKWYFFLDLTSFFWVIFYFYFYFFQNLHPGDSWALVKWVSQQRMSIIDTIEFTWWIMSGMTPGVALSHGPMMKCQHAEDPSLEVMTSQCVIVWLKSIDSLLYLQDETMADLQAICNTCVSLLKHVSLLSRTLVYSHLTS